MQTDGYTNVSVFYLFLTHVITHTFYGLISLVLDPKSGNNVYVLIILAGVMGVFSIYLTKQMIIYNNKALCSMIQDQKDARRVAHQAAALGIQRKEQ